MKAGVQVFSRPHRILSDPTRALLELSLPGCDRPPLDGRPLFPATHRLLACSTAHPGRKKKKKAADEEDGSEDDYWVIDISVEVTDFI